LNSNDGDSELDVDRESDYSKYARILNEENCLDIAPGQHSIPLNIIYVVYAEELLRIAKTVGINT
jgi:hypothetical protein